ncbi:hypothetical protein [Nocardiopsis metallicus]|uniref:Uncharacterized protein n=1 Tax=Nocardiopsis metallicus TaxID=179819 RepID=A0A840VZ50_9ACTN|nr:hypothetical protein [Nocardiopsis metallicus]MBB5489729.1 hypothetical protein [Nocardiopsis metallicus]
MRGTGIVAQYRALAEGDRPVLLDGSEASFDGWVGSDGYPLPVRYYHEYRHEAGGTVSRVGNLVQLGCLQFNEPVDVFFPSGEQIGDAPDFVF